VLSSFIIEQIGYCYTKVSEILQVFLPVFFDVEISVRDFSDPEAGICAHRRKGSLDTMRIVEI
jgi:hypothetical protein